MALFPAGMRDGLAELVRAHLPELARRVIGEEIERIRAEEMSLPTDPTELAAVLREAFSPLVERIARETARSMLQESLPAMAERLVREEIERIRQMD
ncbi:MAG: DUF2497 domain-containing protein [Magnetococcus sp. YQC-9]